jgi:hypothetical protein
MFLPIWFWAEFSRPYPERIFLWIGRFVGGRAKGEES